ncbi:hypothetical protein Scep_014570 [Stephania cephalantha]|uniref:Uncharacterized protein n=1 Tax=Stephania cephalantha TaxID=152367 RepID=A0AAP0P0N0_9MAGN
MLIPRIPSLLLLRKRSSRPGPSTSTRHCSVSFRPLRKIPHFCASRRSRGRVSAPSVADHPLGPAIDHRLGKLLPHQLANRDASPSSGGFLLLLLTLRGISKQVSVLFPSQRLVIKASSNNARKSVLEKMGGMGQSVGQVQGAWARTTLNGMGHELMSPSMMPDTIETDGKGIKEFPK